MRQLLVGMLFSSLATILLAISPEKIIPTFHLSMAPDGDSHLDWDFDNIIFGTSRDEVHPSLCTTPDGQYLYACCSVLDEDGNFDYLRLRFSTDGGLSWEPSMDVASEVPIGIGKVAADNEYVYVVCECFSAAGDIDIYLLRLPTGSTNPQELTSLPIATTSSIEKSPAIHSDGRDEPEDPYIYITHARLREPDSLDYFFHLSVNQGSGLHRSRLLASFLKDSLEGRSSIATAKFQEMSRTYFACEAERSGGRGSMIYLMTSDDFGATWTPPRALSTDYQALGSPSLCVYGGFAVITYTYEPVPHDLDILCSFSEDSGHSWSEGVQVSPGESFDIEPQAVIEPDGSNFHIGFAHFLSEDSLAGTIWARSGTSENADLIGAANVVANDNFAAAGFQIGMCPGPNLSNLRGAAIAWTSYFVTGDLDIKFDASWRGNAAGRISPSAPLRIELAQNYPNPFNPITVIKFALPQNVQVRLDVFNIMGQKATTLVDRPMEAGWHSINFDGSNLASGVYIYRIEAGSFVNSRKMVLIR
ncbi:MAG: T9SS type A sorting domain-containing protein [Calditrichaeota bacterium]|nr:T9SS type A sorting domain-containing protein [Calditrichota bacterium]